jgi:hypothetical protein
MKRKTIIALLALLTVGSVSAQQLQLTLEKSLEIALSDNPTIKVADM